jgi:hypothetical protein
MTNLVTRLRALFDLPQTRLLAQLAPLGIVASCAAAVIGAAIANPALVTTGLGAILAGLATNATSSLLYDIIKPNQAEHVREQAIVAGLKARHPDVIQLVAEALIAAGPDLAQVLPEDARAELIAALEQGMREPGGALAAIAPYYSSALRDVDANWRTLQQELHQAIISVKQTIETGDDAEISGAGQRVEGASGPIEQVIRATGRSQNVNPQQVVIATGRASVGATTNQTAPLSSSGNVDHLQRLIGISTRRLQELEAQAALTGFQTPPAVTLEIADLRDEIARLQEQLSRV